MKANRRNYYRILHVQPEAPPEIITASYRTLMSKLRLHPDLGGDHDTAVLVNQAYAVLSDPKRREEYDRGLQRGAVRAYPAPRGPGMTGASAQPPTAIASCRFCSAELPARIGADTRCRHCDSPLAPPPRRPEGRYELLGRRGAPRILKSDIVCLYPGWQRPAGAARMHDLSLTGISVVTGIAVQARQVIRIVGPAFDVVADVICCRPDQGGSKLHARLLTAIFMTRTGVLVSTQA